MKAAKSLFCAAAVLAGTSTVAGASGHDIGLNVGSLGVGPQLGYTLSPNQFHVRLATGFLDYSDSAVAEGIEYDGDLQLRNAALLGDYHPFGGGFRISAGVVGNDNAFSATGELEDGTTYTADGETYTADSGDSANGEITFNSLAPYLGIGVGHTDTSTGLSLTADVGVMHLGSASASIDIDTQGSTRQAEADEYAANAESDLEDELEALELYPVIQADAVYRF